MKKLSLLFFVMATTGIASARVMNIPTQPMSPFADTEVSTNLVIHPSRTDVRDVKIHLQLSETAYNDLEIGFGRDVNTNGVLDVEEIETVYGWRGGRYFIENTRTWDRFETEAAYNAHHGVVDIHMVLDSNSALTSFTATCGGQTAFPSLAATPSPAWLYRNNWKLMRIVRRGAAAPSEWVRCEVGYNFFVIKLR